MFTKLKELYRQELPKTEMAELWGNWSKVQPALVDEEFGDGLQIIGFQTLNHRPEYYVVFIDSSWELDNDGYNELLINHLDEIKDAIAEQFGEFHDCDYDECKEENGGESCGYHTEDEAWFPVLSDDAGSLWWEIVNLPKGGGYKQLADIRKKKHRLFDVGRRAA